MTTTEHITYTDGATDAVTHLCNVGCHAHPLASIILVLALAAIVIVVPAIVIPRLGR